MPPPFRRRGGPSRRPGASCSGGGRTCWGRLGSSWSGIVGYYESFQLLSPQCIPKIGLHNLGVCLFQKPRQLGNQQENLSDSILSSFTQTQALPRASREDVGDYRRFLATRKPIAEAETRFLDAPGEDLVCLAAAPTTAGPLAGVPPADTASSVLSSSSSSSDSILSVPSDEQSSVSSGIYATRHDVVEPECGFLTPVPGRRGFHGEFLSRSKQCRQMGRT